MMPCPVCKTENRPVANFCRRCGALLATRCPRCHSALPEEAVFCDHCGLRLMQPAVQAWSPNVEQAWARDVPAAQPAELAGPPSPATPPPMAEPQARPAATAVPQTALQQFIPAELMARLQAADQRGGMVGERRIVTILFCDTVGSTAAAEQLDPEEWTEIINGAFEHMIRPIYRYEGTVARLMGDGLLAFFGAPIAHEDDPRRAVLAGLDIVREIAAYAPQVKARWGIDLDVRVGINTGKVVVGGVGSDLRMEYTAIGDAINVSARMEQTAEPGTVQLAQETYGFVESFFEVEVLAPITVKGKEAPLKAYRVLGPRRQAARRRAPAGLQAPLLGRDDELARLRQAAQSAQQGVGQIVCLVGEAGLGKSRLVEELRQDYGMGAVHGQPLRWLEATGAAHEAGEPFALLRGLLRDMGGAHGADPAELRNRLLVQAPFDQREELGAVLDVLLQLPGTTTNGAHGNGSSGAQLTGEAFRRRLSGAMQGLLASAAAQGPLALVLDDMHWADAASVELLLQLLVLVESLPLFFLCAMRPERQAPSWRLRQEAEAGFAHRMTVINVRPLAPEDSRRLITSLLGDTFSSDTPSAGAASAGAASADHRLPQQVRQLILDKAEGNPFFVEEVVRSLVDRGLVESGEEGLRWRGDHAAEEIVIPDSLQSLLTARIDRLQEETRYTLQLASVIGRSFTYRILEQVSKRGEALLEQLEDLQRRAVIREAARLPELEYMFHHALMQEAAYRSILLRQRRAFHLRVAEAIEQLFADRLEAFALPLARHYFEAGDRRAPRYFRMAGDAAMRVFANVEAAEHYAMAIQCARQAPDGQEVASEEELLYLYRRRGRALELNSRYEEALHHYQELMALAQDCGSPRMELAALVGQARQRVTANPVTNYEEGRSLLDQALPLARQLDDREAEATIMWLEMLMLMFGSDREEQLAVAERGLALARELGLQELEGFILHDLWYVYGGLGRWREMDEALHEACRVWQALDNLPMLAASLTRLNFSQAAAGRYDQALETSARAYELSVQGRDVESQALSRALLGLIHLDRGNPHLALAALNENLALAEPIGNVTVMSTGPAYKGWVYAALGDFERATSLARAGVDFALDRFPLIAVMPQAILVRILLMQGEREQAQQVFEMMEDYRSARRRIGFFAMSWLMAMVATGELALIQEDHERALAVAEEFIASAAEGDLHFLLPDAYLLHGRALSALGRNEEAAKALQKGVEEAETLGSQRTLWSILAELGALAAAGGDHGKAEEFRARAAEVVGFIADHAGSEALRASFLNLERVRTLLGQ